MKEEEKYYLVSLVISYDDLEIYSHRVLTTEEYEEFTDYWDFEEHRVVDTEYAQLEIYASQYVVKEISKSEVDVLNAIGLDSIGDSIFFDFD